MGAIKSVTWFSFSYSSSPQRFVPVAGRLAGATLSRLLAGQRPTLQFVELQI
ncbi:MAG: hypothetical protein ACI92G_000009 [Candidatus Pelagisphaera sp.]|jgi:hypothetical protein